jgi:hypothetical protein
VKLLGLEWNRGADSIAAPKLKLSEVACTKRQILSSIASNFDLFNFNGPLLNRARLFMHQLQCDSALSWDKKLSPDKLMMTAENTKEMAAKMAAEMTEETAAEMALEMASGMTAKITAEMAAEMAAEMTEEMAA